MARFRLIIATTLAAAALAGCSSGGSPSSAPPSGASAGAPVGSGGLQIAARDIKFDRTELALPANQPTSLLFDNQEGAPHNVEIKNAAGASVFTGEIFTGPAQRTYQVPALAAGTYSFLCTVHPDMKGTLTAQ
ncbi:MAG: cupredoxin domain-containing protein [Chloroflexi bacterium]|nr:cupredoxin domain-containing protein [Chloroflexota bacterium]